jgi:L-iditol 2-dehydrogenase
MSKFQAVLFYKPKKIKLAELERKDLHKNEVRVKILYALTGGTDVKTYLRGHPKLIKETPSTFGYELCGEVIESKNPKFQIGDKIISANTVPCDKCFFCNKNQAELCENLEFLNGSFAQEIVIPAALAKVNLYKISKTIDPKIAAFTQTLAVCLLGFERTHIKDNDIVCVYGIGAVGQCFIQLCKTLRENVTVVAIGSSDIKKKLAKKYKADLVLDYKKDDIEKEIKKLYPHGVDKIIEATGKPEVWQDCLKFVRQGGLINYFGGCPKDSSIKISTYDLHYKEITLTGSFHHTPKHIQQALTLLQSNVIKVDDLISDTMQLEDLEKALKLMIKGEAIKVAIKTSH